MLHPISVWVVVAAPEQVLKYISQICFIGVQFWIATCPRFSQRFPDAKSQEKINSVQTRRIVKGEAQKSPPFWRFSGGLCFFLRIRMFSRNSKRIPLNLIESLIFKYTPCKSACLYNAPSIVETGGSYRPRIKKSFIWPKRDKQGLFPLLSSFYKETQKWPKRLFDPQSDSKVTFGAQKVSFWSLLSLFVERGQKSLFSLFWVR